MRHFSKISLGLGATMLAVSPASAVDLPRVGGPGTQSGYATQTVLDDGGDVAEHRRWRYRDYDRDRIDAGDLIAGALIIGGIFAIASAASDSNDRYDSDYRSNDDFDRVVDRCVREVERGQRIGSVDNVGRTRSGYSVGGTLYDGTPFACRLSPTGRVLDVEYGYGRGYGTDYGGVRYESGGEVYGDPQYAGPGYGDGQYSDETYARARANTYTTPDGTARPAYPGGPVPGEEYPDQYGGEDYGEDYQGEPY